LPARHCIASQAHEGVMSRSSFGQQVRVANVAFDDLQIGIVLGQKRIAKEHDVVNRNLVATVQRGSLQSHPRNAEIVNVPSHRSPSGMDRIDRESDARSTDDDSLWPVATHDRGFREVGVGAGLCAQRLEAGTVNQIVPPEWVNGGSSQLLSQRLVPTRQKSNHEPFARCFPRGRPAAVSYGGFLAGPIPVRDPAQMSYILLLIGGSKSESPECRLCRSSTTIRRSGRVIGSRVGLLNWRTVLYLKRLGQLR
jgi:hypothetical protein